MIDGKKLIELLEDAGYEPRPYSGRAMYGKRCVGVDCDREVNPFTLGVRVAQQALAQATGVQNQNDIAEELESVINEAGDTMDELAHLRTYQDSMGMGSIIYFPAVIWPEEEK